MARVLRDSLLSGVGVAVLALGIALLITWRKDAGDVSNLGQVIIGVAGTMVALALPAAELMSNTLVRASEHWLNRIKDESHSNPNKLGEVAGHAKEALGPFRDMGNTALLASIMVFIAMLLGILALLVKAWPVCESWPWSPQDPLGAGVLCVSLAMSFLVIGSFWYFPVAYQVYRFRTFDRFETFLDGLIARQQQASKPGVKAP